MTLQFAVANQLKEEANAFFKAGDNHSAVTKWDEALTTLEPVSTCVAASAVIVPSTLVQVKSWIDSTVDVAGSHPDAPQQLVDSRE